MNPIIGFIITYSPAVIGFAMPLLVELISRHLTNSNLKFAATFAVCLVVASALNLEKILTIGVGSVPAVFSLLTLMFTESQVVFKLWFSTSTLRQSMQTNPAVPVIAK